MEFVKIARAIGILNRTFQSYISNAVSDYEISYSDSIFLVNIGNQPGISQEELSNLLSIDKAAIARSVKSLEKTGYIRSKRSSQDKRAKELHLTDSGETFIQFMDDLHQQWINHVTKGMSEEEIEIFSNWIDLMGSQAKDFKINDIDIAT